MTAGRWFLWMAWGVSICFQITTASIEPRNSNSLILSVLTVAILGLIYRLEDLERRIVGHVQEPELKRALDAKEKL